jgi:outer membrane protein TolC
MKHLHTIILPGVAAAYLTIGLCSGFCSDEAAPAAEDPGQAVEAPQPEKPCSPLLSEDVQDTSVDGLALLKENSYHVSLDSVTDYVTSHNPSIKEAYLTWQSKHKQAKAAFGDFEPALSLNGGKNSQSRENNVQQMLQQNYNPFFSEENYEYGAGIGGKFFSGTNYNVGYTTKKLKNSLSTAIQYESFLGVTAEQPLLKGMMYKAPTASIRVTAKEDTIAFNTYRKQLMETVAQAEAYYWNLAYARELYRISDESVTIAQMLFKDSQEQAKVGKLSEADLVQAKAELQNRFAERNRAFQNLLEASTNLKLLLSDPEISPVHILVTAEQLVKVADNSALQPEDIQDTYMSALITQPDMVIRRQELDREQIRLSYYRSQRLPELNLKSSFGYNGLGLSEHESWDKVNNREYPAWSVMAEMKIPFFGGIREANELRAARINADIASQRLKATEYELSRSFSSLRQRLASLESQIESTKTAAQCKNQILEIGITRFQEGKINIWEIYRLEGELFDAKKEELQTRLRYKETFLQLQYIQGLVLFNKGIEKMEDGIFTVTEDLS